MPLFRYKAVNVKGDVVTDSVTGETREGVAATLKADKLKVLLVKEIKSTPSPIFSKRVPLSEKANFCRFMATMLHAGLSVSEGAEVVKQETQSEKMKTILSDLSFETRRGGSVASVLTKYKDDFDPVILAIIKVGEESGSLDKSFEYLAVQLADNYEMNQKIKGSMMYPAVIVMAAAGMGVFMLVWVLPRIAGSFLKLNLEMPEMTKMVMRFGYWIGENTILFLGIIVVLAVGVFVALMLKPIRLFLLNVASKIRPIQRVLNQIDVARYARTLSILLKRGVPIVDALEVTADTLKQPKMRDFAKSFGGEVTKGTLLSEVLDKKRGVFPPAMVQTIRAGYIIDPFIF
ncbi:type II secretion system F family protein [Patescibacteria group bacterium]